MSSLRVRTLPWRSQGFTLIEIVAVLAIVAILVAFLVPVAFQSITSSKEEGTKGDVERIFKAIIGDPDKGNFGYLGDMGRLPATLSELVEQGSQLAFHTSHTAHAGSGDHVGGVGTGWRGPYLTGKFVTSELFKDAWGQPLSYTNSGNTAGQIISGGSDGDTATTGDNIVFPVQLPVLTTGTLIVTVVVNDIPQPTGLTVDVFSTTSTGDQGSAVTKTTAADGKVPFRFTVPHGVSAVRATHTASGVTVTRTIDVPVVAGTQVARQIIMKTTATVAM